MLRRYQQVILHKRCTDPFDEPRIDRVLSEVCAAEFLLIGACAEGAVKAAALGLLQRDKKVSVVIDAVGYHDNHEAKMAFRKMEAKGAKLIETRRLAGISHLRQVGICDCETCQRMYQKATSASGRRLDPALRFVRLRLRNVVGRTSERPCILRSVDMSLHSVTGVHAGARP